MHHPLLIPSFFVLLGLLVYTWAGYPLLLLVTGALFGRRRAIDEGYRPMVSLIIPAHNEEECIEKKIRNSLALDYPADLLEIIVASDGSTDKTVEIARTFSPRVIVQDYPDRRGKMGTVNRTIPDTRGEIIVLTDSNAMFAGYTVRELVKYFADAGVGIVSGAKIIRNSGPETQTGMGEGSYWKYESLLKRAETLTGSCVGADGSVYAIRRDIYPFPPDDKIVMDDFAVSLMVIRKGFECVYEPAARAFEESAKIIGQEFKRKGRILAGAISILIQMPSLMVTPFAFKLISHKVLRWSTIIFQTALLFVSWKLSDVSSFRPIFGVQIVFYACALLGWLLGRANMKVAIFHIPYYFTMTTLAQLYGVFYYIKNAAKPMWEKIR